jgi:hypothetical protein
VSDEDYLNGWNDRRELERKILDAINNPSINPVHAKFLEMIREELTADNARRDESQE